MHDTDAIDELTAQVDELARFCARLSKENVELRSKVSALSARQSPAAASMPPPLAAVPGSLREVAEREISRRTVGVALVGAAAGVVGAGVLTDRGTRPTAASAVTSTAAHESTQVELTAVEETASATPTSPGGVVSGMLAPAIVTLADAPGITVDAARGNDFRVTLGGDRTLDNPTGSVDGQRITFTIRQGSGAPHKVAWSSQYKFGAAGVPVLSTTAGSADVIGFIYNHSLGSWLCVGAARGF